MTSPTPRDYWVARLARALYRGRAKTTAPVDMFEAVQRARQIDARIGRQLFEEDRTNG